MKAGRPAFFRRAPTSTGGLGALLEAPVTLFPTESGQEWVMSVWHLETWL
jgi:hypothetical protein